MEGKQMSCKHCHHDHEEEHEHEHEHGHSHEHGHEHGGEGENRKVMLIRIGVSAVLLLIGWLAPLPEWLKIVCFAASYLVVGYQVVIEAVKSILRL